MSHAPLDYLLMFSCSFLMVFLLGLQSKNVNQSRYLAAVVTSLGISIANFMFVKYASGGSFDVFAACAAGGCCGIAFSIWFYDTIMRPKRTRSSQVASAHVDTDTPLPWGRLTPHNVAAWVTADQSARYSARFPK